ncbi:hypothetical protein K503DRAFT_82274 [Rhizopogon vinicolor AM-OR11-026]|uniref:Uncharacterized protein n=1 Tax=Rhizopogon vinicolor AM-OR11-026 TaxID=1314800 RepID=A0A1B7N3T3_9AGAM|nr:hypothetical protein K503DRAFT_82274 [Rhizopogon vinicolor AM-OR11-026]
MWSWTTQPDSHPQRKFIDLIFNRTGKYANWDPPSEIQVGSYGKIDSTTGDLIVLGTIYSDEFKKLLLDVGISVESGEHHPKYCPDEIEFTAWSKNVRRLDLNVVSDVSIPGIDTATIKGTWEVKKGTTGAVLLMHNPRLRCITSSVLGKLSNIALLRSMHLVTKVFYCPAFSLYLSDKSKCTAISETGIIHSGVGGEKVSIALLNPEPVVEPMDATVGATAMKKWWCNTQAGFERHGCNTEHCFTPLYELLHVRRSRNRRSSSSPERTGEELWIAPPLPWAPLDEDGKEVPIYFDDSDSDSGSEEE